MFCWPVSRQHCYLEINASHDVPHFIDMFPTPIIPGNVGRDETKTFQCASGLKEALPPILKHFYYMCP